MRALLANARLAQRSGAEAAAKDLPRTLAALARTEDAAEGARSFAERRAAVTGA